MLERIEAHVLSADDIGFAIEAQFSAGGPAEGASHHDHAVSADRASFAEDKIGTHAADMQLDAQGASGLVIVGQQVQRELLVSIM